MVLESPRSPSSSAEGDTPPSLIPTDGPETPRSNMTSLPTPESRHSAMAMPTPTAFTSQRQAPSAIRRTRSPPRNESDKMVCDHPDCFDKHPQEEFSRLCEWNKHMDRHERPYKCQQKGCELNPGFTYSGGLLRHEREVHKMHLTTKVPLYCPFPNCNRSSGGGGEGFTRKENLEEHKRRRHLGEMRASQSPALVAAQPATQTMASSRKRKKLPTPPDLADDETEDVVFPSHKLLKTDVSGIEANPTVRALRSIIAQKDEMILRQQIEIQRMQNLIANIPHQALYSINTSSMMGSSGGGGGVSGQHGNAYAPVKMT
jgi:hypothetical protein